MLRAELAVTPTGASVRLDANGAPVATYRLSRADGEGPIPAATAVLARNGWTIAGQWVHTFGGITGDVWTAGVEQAAEGQSA